MLLAPVARDAFGLANGMLGGIGSAFNPLAGAAAAMRGRERAAEETARLLGLARGFGGASAADSQSLYDSIRPLYEAEAEGAAQVRKDLALSTAGDTAEDLVQRFIKAITGLVEWLENRGVV
jgi:succinate dehydrogenase/fumarate reductase flavoprotein subunit